MRRIPHYDLQERLDEAFARELVEEGRNPSQVLSEQAASRRPAQDKALREAFEYHSGVVHRANHRLGRAKR